MCSKICAEPVYKGSQCRQGMNIHQQGSPFSLTSLIVTKAAQNGHKMCQSIINICWWSTCCSSMLAGGSAYQWKQDLTTLTESVWTLFVFSSGSCNSCNKSLFAVSFHMIDGKIVDILDKANDVLGADGGIDFDAVRVFEESKQSCTVKNKGKYDISYS